MTPNQTDTGAVQGVPSDLIKRLQTWPFENGNRLSTEATFSLVNEAIAEIERLQQAKRAALQVADERSKENVSLRATGKRAADFIRTVDPFGDHFSEYDLRILAGEPTGALPEPEDNRFNEACALGIQIVP